MAVPKKKRSYMKRHKRRSHHALEKQSLSVCPQCQMPMPPHSVCDDQGFNCALYKPKDKLRASV